MALEKTWRWFGPSDPISLKEVKQTGATGIVSALHQVPVGEIWTVEAITERKQMIEAEGLTWSVVESLPVHENIKKRAANYNELIENYKVSIRNLAECGIDTICYNFMPVLDWSRTNLMIPFSDGSFASGFLTKAFNAFDLFILKRKDAEKVLTTAQAEEAKRYFDSLTGEEKDKLTKAILFGLPGSWEQFTLEELRQYIAEYEKIGDKELRENLYSFLKEAAPVAEEAGVFLAIHPDDPPRPLLGLPRVVSNKDDLSQLIQAYDSPANGITLCTGALGAGYYNNLSEIAEMFAHRINFVHLRNVQPEKDGSFIEVNHLEGAVDMFAVIRTLLKEQKNRESEGKKNSRMPMRPDHGHLMLDDQHTRTFYPGYSLYGRMRGLAELRGLEMGISLTM
jgi:mannonate dehydratase